MQATTPPAITAIRASAQRLDSTMNTEQETR